MQLPQPSFPHGYKECRQCLQTIDRRAKICPFCRSKQSSKSLLSCMGILLLCLLGFCLLTSVVAALGHSTAKQTDEANAHVQAAVEAATVQLESGDVQAAKTTLAQAHSIPHAQAFEAVTMWEVRIAHATDPASLRRQLIDLPEDEYTALKTQHTVPPSLRFGAKVLDERAMEQVHKLLADDAPLLAERQARQKQAADAENAHRQAAEAEAARKAAAKEASRLESEKTDAYVIATQFMEKRLKAPSTASWPGMFDDRGTVVRQSDGSYRVTSWVDAQNGFGAKLRIHYTATLRHDLDDRWSLLNLQTDE